MKQRSLFLKIVMRSEIPLVTIYEYTSVTNDGSITKIN